MQYIDKNRSEITMKTQERISLAVILIGALVIIGSILTVEEPDLTLSPDMVSYRQRYGQGLVFTEAGPKAGDIE